MRPKARLILPVAAALGACTQPSLVDLDQPVAVDTAAGSVSEAPVARSGIRGRVQTQDGLPVAGAVIQIQCAAKPCKPIPDIGVLSNADGVFFWPLQPGNYRLTAHKDDRSSCPQTALVSAAKDEQLTLILSPSGTAGCSL